ncbi:Regulator of RNase E activity RraA [Algoriphagus halophilus]|uniref:Regulator of RNase E activity RraA n=2 Tax=Algoriphagus halophilus TaxID=226505 RepID=A0A1N6D7Q1_9BACT|nr:Regulator of RNase E activity RraA [Algoriphagus halophilus]
MVGQLRIIGAWDLLSPVLFKLYQIMIKKISLTLSLLILIVSGVFAQQISKEEMLFLTQKWTGERFEDGRPKVSDDILRRMKEVTHDEAWAVMKNEGYRYQYADGWGLMINPDSVLVGRALTATFMPGRPDIHDAIDERGKKEGKRGQNSWPVDLLVPGDVYVVDQFGIHNGGPTIGDNVGNAIYAKSGNGIIYDGAIRDIVGLKEIGSFTSYVSSYHPSHHNQPGDLNTMLIGINKPTRIHQVTVMAGDVVLGRDGGVSFIPAHLAEKVVVTSEVVRLRDMFGHQRIREGKYTAGQIDTRWSDEIEKDFSQWLNDHIDELPIAREQIQEILKKRTW